MTKQTKSSVKLESLTQRHPSRQSLVGSGGFQVLSGAKLEQLQKDLNRGWQFMPIQRPRPQNPKAEK